MQRIAITGLLVFMLLAFGCDKGQKTPAPSDPAAPAPAANTPAAAPAAEQGVIRVPLDKLPKVGGPMPPLEGGTLEMARPEGWDRLPRSDKDYVCAFNAEKGAELPRMVLRALPNPLPSITKVTEANVEEFTRLTAKRLAEAEQRKELSVKENPLAMVIGDKPCVRYVLLRPLGKNSTVAVEQQMIEAVHNGKLYQLSLDVFAKGILAHRNEAYAVFASMDFTEAAASATPAEPAAEPTPDSAPAAEPAEAEAGS